MSVQNIVQKLNNTAMLLRNEQADIQTNDGLDITFACGNFNSDLVNHITALAPSGKIFILYTRSSYQKYGKQLIYSLKALNREYVDVIMSNERVDAIDRISGIFNVGDDARLILTFDYALYGVVSYFAHVRNLPCVCCVDKFPVKDLLSPTVELLNGDTIDVVNVRCPKTVYIKHDFDDQDGRATAYAHVISGISGLVDYRIARICSKKQFSKKAYSVARDAVYTAYAVLKQDLKTQCVDLLYSSIALELANAYSDGLTYRCSACQGASKLINKKDISDCEGAFFACLALLQIYHYIFSAEKVNLLEYPQLLTRAKDINGIYPIDQKTLIKNLIEQGGSVKRNLVALKETVKKICAEVESLAKCVPTIRQTYYALGGQAQVEAQTLAKAIKYSGDLTELVNGVSILREYGVTELI